MDWKRLVPNKYAVLFTLCICIYFYSLNQMDNNDIKRKLYQECGDFQKRLDYSFISSEDLLLRFEVHDNGADYARAEAKFEIFINCSLWKVENVIAMDSVTEFGDTAEAFNLKTVKIARSRDTTIRIKVTGILGDWCLGIYKGNDNLEISLIHYILAEFVILIAFFLVCYWLKYLKQIFIPEEV